MYYGGPLLVHVENMRVCTCKDRFDFNDSYQVNHVELFSGKLNILNWMFDTIVPPKEVDTIRDSSGRTIFDMNEYLISPQLHLYLEQFRASTPSIFRNYQTGIILERSIPCLRMCE